jgi:rhamnosyltransferase
LPNASDLSEARIIVPVRNGGLRWREAAAALRDCVPDPAMVVVVDSESTDGSAAVAAQHGFGLHRIDVRTFNHGRTRQEAVERFCSGKQFAIFLTQDAIVASRETLITLLAAFSDPQVGAAYGRQLPHHNAAPCEAHAALFNYPPLSERRTLADRSRLGVKVAYLSNSFAAYRLRALSESGGFPGDFVMGEDTCVAFRMLTLGWAVMYCAEARVRHSHSYSIVQEMQRYFDSGVLYAQFPDITRTLGSLEGEGMRFVLSELRHVSAVAPWSLPEVIVRNIARYIGYRLGRAFRRLPRRVRRGCSLTKGYWDAVQHSRPASS